MDEKLTIEELIAGIAAKQNMEQADAEAFVCSFFAQIEECLKKDKYVRIKGFGTFKLIDTDSEGGRVVYVPEATVRDIVNKPFAHFQPVELNDGVHFGDIEEEEIKSSDDVVAACGNAVSEPVPEVSEGEDSNNMQETEVIPAEVNEKVHDSGKRRGTKSWYLLAAALLIGIVIGCGIMWGVFFRKDTMSDGSVETNIPEAASSEQSIVPSLLVTDSVFVEEDSVVADDTVAVEKKTVDSIINVATASKDEVKYLTDEVAYKISGTLDTYEIAKGSTLSKVAYRYYKNRKLWPYIVMYNKDVIADPNNVPIGTVLRIPRLIPAD